ncbi:DUF3043 domain-containing protein [Lysinimonas soli]|uniref:DUF3043 domain-containing protein n=1 Tax=Lysinimonas soli TaxID=1074233 RepID=A0ABW0NQN7_9MICO
MAKTPKTDRDATAAEPADEAGVDAPVTKGRPTPTRKEQEAARKQPLVPSDRRLAARQSRDQAALQREKARIGMAQGNDKYLPLRDKGPQKRYVRDFVDARFSLGEVLLPILVLVILTYFLPVQYSSIALIAVWGVLIIVVADGLYLGASVNRKLGDKFGKDKVERGVRWYAFMRAIQLRPMRLPKPQVKRGQYPS